MKLSISHGYFHVKMVEELTCSSYTAPELFDSQESNSSDRCLNCTHLMEQLIIAQ